MDSKPAPDAKAEMLKNAAMRTGGAYIPPARLRALMEQTVLDTDPQSEVYQRLRWDALRKSLNGLINKARCFVLDSHVF